MPFSSGSHIAITLAGETRPNGLAPWSTYSDTYTDVFTMYSENHSKRTSEYDDNGGPFFLDKVEWHVVPYVANNGLDRGPIAVKGVNFTDAPNVSDISPITEYDGQALGTTAIARTTPTTSRSNLLQTLAETYRDGIPKVLGGSLRERTAITRKAGGEYLNVEFGWKPLISDIRDISHAITNGQRYIDGYVKHSDTRLHRRYDYPGVTASGESHGNANFTNAQSYALGTGSSYSFRKEATWFEGAYRYHVPSSSEQLGTLRSAASKANYLLGIKPTPEILWNLAPWSWAADWFGNAGDIIHNISALGTDGLLLQYGYLMHSGIHNHTMLGHNNDGTSTVSRTHTIKQRFASTPWGFGFNLDGLNNHQIAIATAIGLTRGGRPWHMRQ